MMRSGIFYRSQVVSQLTPEESATLVSTLRIGLDIDLRTPSEWAGPANPPISLNAGPDILPDWVKRGWRHLPD
jgi:hypothetical protein